MKDLFGVTIHEGARVGVRDPWSTSRTLIMATVVGFTKQYVKLETQRTATTRWAFNAAPDCIVVSARGIPSREPYGTQMFTHVPEPLD